jgi:signal transduction histidine kinase
MRFDDTIATVLAQPADAPGRGPAQWRQLVDLLAQRRAESDPFDVERAFDFLRRHRARVDPAVRAAAARDLAGLAVDPDLVVYFAEDSPSIAAPLIAAASLDAGDWLDVLPRLGPPARALLRHRRDLPAEVRQALGAFGASDLVLETRVAAEATVPAAGPERAESQIRELVERIEAYRKQKAEDRYRAPPAPEPEPEPVEGFRWEAGGDGIVRWIEGAPREALVGQTIAAIAGPGHYGVDGQAAGAFEKRAPFRDARFRVPGEGAAAGDWRISGVPFFDPARGSFQGYRGTARRPRLDEVARNGGDVAAGAGLFGTHLPADSLRELIHELRTPLNAIIGFAELIEGQYMGPAAAPYRGRAAEIMDQARRLLSAVDDLDTAARIETRRLDLQESAVDAAALLGRLHESYERVAAQRGASLTLEVAADLPPAAVEPGAVERMFARLLAATIGLAGEGETISAEMDAATRGNRPMLRLSVDRPESIEGLEDEALLDPGYSPEGDWPGAPALGLGFALRLVRNLAEAAGGALLIGETRISLWLPALVPAASAAGNGDSGA